MQSKFHIKKGDIVRVISGNDKGTEAKVLMVDHKKYRALVEGVNMVSKHTKPNAANPQGGILKKEATVHLSNLMIVDSKGNATRTERRLDENNKLVRYSKKSGEVIK